MVREYVVHSYPLRYAKFFLRGKWVSRGNKNLNIFIIIVLMQLVIQHSNLLNVDGN